MTVCNSLYFYTHECYQTNCKRYNLPYIWSHSSATHCKVVATKLQQFFSTTLQLPYDYNYNVMLTSFFIHSSNFNTWHYEMVNFFWNIDMYHPLWLFILYGFTLWHVAQSKVVTWHINWILETNTYTST
jgi:hypothetical protein